MKVVTADQMRDIEARAAAVGLTSPILMENAGLAVAREIESYLGQVFGAGILFLIGPGNNGGDGLVAARYLHDWGSKVTAYLCAARRPDDRNLLPLVQRGVDLVVGSEDSDFSSLQAKLDRADVVVDALFGTGKMRPLEGIFGESLLRAAAAKGKRRNLRVIALDIPSGLDPDTGAVDPACLVADLTITLSSPKLGLYSFPGAEKTGRIVVADIGIPGELTADLSISVITEDWVKATLPRRPLDANKGTFGKVMVVAGSINYIGAAYLACQAACRSGAGLVTLAAPRSLIPILATRLVEATYSPLPEVGGGYIAAEAAPFIQKAAAGYDALLVGCGLGQNPATSGLIAALGAMPPGSLPVKLVIDADGLNLLSGLKDWPKLFSGGAVLTPHPGEMARLMGRALQQVQSNRLETALESAREWGKTVLLKGAFTIIASPSRKAMINPVAEPALSSAGTGDVLSGIIAGLMAQGLDSFNAAGVGVYLHAAAAHAMAGRIGRAGVLASDLLPEIPAVMKRLRGDNQ